MAVEHSQSAWGSFACWVVFFVLILSGWVVLFAMSADFAARAPVALLGPGMDALAPLFPGSSSGLVLPIWLVEMCNADFSAAGAEPLALAGMWTLMALAMMAPTATPMLQTYAGLVAGNPSRVPPAGFWGLLGGFCVAWIGFAAIASMVQWWLSSAGLLSLGGLLRSAAPAAALLALAGLYQFSTLKAACLSRCRSPMAFFLARWREGVAGAFNMGLQQGFACLGCCWALMALAFVGGTMNLVWMGAAMVLMTVEKLPSLGRYITTPLGVGLLASSAVVAWHAASG